MVLQQNFIILQWKGFLAPKLKLLVLTRQPAEAFRDYGVAGFAVV